MLSTGLTLHLPDVYYSLHLTEIGEYPQITVYS